MTLENNADPGHTPQKVASDQSSLRKLQEVKGQIKQSKSPFMTIFLAYIQRQSTNSVVSALIKLCM